MGLTITLKPGERIAINGAVLRNGERRATISLENTARILRERDIMQPAEATSPARLIYFAIMLLYLADGEDRTARGEFHKRVEEFAGVVINPDALARVARMAALVANGAYYKAMEECRSLIAYEDERLSDVA